jgi:hypothetical protein
LREICGGTSLQIVLYSSCPGNVVVVGVLVFASDLEENLVSPNLNSLSGSQGLKKKQEVDRCT